MDGKNNNGFRRPVISDEAARQLENNGESSATQRHRRSDKYKTAPSTSAAPSGNNFRAQPLQPSFEEMTSDEQTKEVRPVNREYSRQQSELPYSQAASSISEKAPNRQEVPIPASLSRVNAAKNSGSAERQPSSMQRPVARQNLSVNSQYKRPGADYNTDRDSGSRKRETVQNFQEDRPAKKHIGLAVAIAVVLLIAAVVLALLLTPSDSTSPIAAFKNKVVSLLGTETKSVPQATDFSAAPTNGVAPQNIAFTITTNASAKAVRVVDENGTVVTSLNHPTTSNSESQIWAMTFLAESAYKHIVTVEINDGEAWISTLFQANIDITDERPASELPTSNLVVITGNEVPESEETTAGPAESDVPDYVNPDELYEYSDEAEEGLAEPVADSETMVSQPENNVVVVPVQPETHPPVMMNTATPSLPPLPTAAPETSVIALTPYSPMAQNGNQPDAEQVSDFQPPYDEESNEPQSDEYSDEPDYSETTSDEPVAEEPPVIMPPEVTPSPDINPAAGDNTTKIKSQYVFAGTSKKAEENYSRKDEVSMSAADDYVNVPFGVITFRGNAFRQNSTYGTVGAEAPTEMDVMWQMDVGSLKGKNETYYGVGLGSQPAIVKWSKDVRATLGLNEDKADKSKLKEVIVAALDGKIYFLDLDDGSATRDPIKVGFPMRGTPALHTLGLPIMMVGQNARNLANKSGDIGLRFFDLSSGKQTNMINGIDSRAYGTIGSFNTSALIDKNSDTMVAIGTNGMLYTAKLNSEVSADGKVSFKPEIVAMKSMVSGGKENLVGTDSSLAMYQGYAYFADKAGYIHCIDVNSMTDLWASSVNDETQAALSLDFVDGNLCIFTANTLKNRAKGDCQIRCIDAESGEVVWQTDIGVQKDTKTSKRVGTVASPVIGSNSLSDYAYFTITGLKKDASIELTGEETACTAAVVAVEKATGHIVWTKALDSYSYSSPVAVYNDSGDGWIIQATGKGTLVMLDGKTGEEVCTLSVDGVIEGSPAVYLDTLVIGTTGKGTSHIYGIGLK